MKIKEQAIKELETLKSAELMMVYDLMLLFKGKVPEYRVKESLPAYVRVRNALKQCNGSISEDILAARNDRI